MDAAKKLREIDELRCRKDKITLEFEKLNQAIVKAKEKQCCTK